LESVTLGVMSEHDGAVGAGAAVTLDPVTAHLPGALKGAHSVCWRSAWRSPVTNGSKRHAHRPQVRRSSNASLKQSENSERSENSEQGSVCTGRVRAGSPSRYMPVRVLMAKPAHGLGL
jgi:hypothetical protein